MKLKRCVIDLKLILNLLILPNLLLGQAFKDVADEANLGHISSNNGLAVADYDLDGDLDVMLMGYRSFDVNNDSTWNRLLRNEGDGTFADVTVAAGFGQQFVNADIRASSGEKMGASWGDYDNDGYPDLFLTNSREDQLYHNEGDGTFIDVTETAGVAGCHECYSGSSLWWDHDRDGDLDLYVSILNGANIFYENKGDGTFRNATNQWQLGGFGVTWTSVALDIGRDGFLDLYNVNDTQINELYENRTGLRYNETSRAYRVADEGAGMGVAIGDYNNDGFFDIYVTNIYNHHPNPLLKNTGNRRFENVAAEMGVENTGWGWGTHFFDFDHDGDEDLYAVNGVVSKQYIDGIEQVDEPNFFFKNTLIEGEEGFLDWSAESGTNAWARARGMEVFDYDGDGDLDILVANVESKPYLFRSETIGLGEAMGKNWLQVKLEGTVSNRNAFGTEIRVTINNQTYYRYHHGAAFFGQSIKPVHFGLGAATNIDTLVVIWPNMEKEIFTNIATNQLIKVVQGGSLTNVLNLQTPNVGQIITSPNPFQDGVKISVQTEIKGKYHFQIFSAYGQLVHQHSGAHTKGSEIEFQWDGNNLNGSRISAGIYLVVANFSGKLFNAKIIKK